MQLAICRQLIDLTLIDPPFLFLIDLTLIDLTLIDLTLIGLIDLTLIGLIDPPFLLDRPDPDRPDRPALPS